MAEHSILVDEDCQIRIEGLSLLASIGIYPHELAERQALRVDVAFTFDAGLAGLSDDIRHTIDYDRVAQRLEQVVGERHFNLLETLARAMLLALADSFPMRRMAVTVHKPAALAGVARVSVSRHLVRDLR